METHELAVERRVKTGKGSAHKSRARGHAPGVVYGKEIQPFSISFVPTALRTVLKSPRGRNSVFRLAVDDGQSVLAMVQDIQIDPLSRTIIHSDFLQISEEQPVVVPVPLHLEGRAEGVKAGGLLEQHVRSVTVRCLPKDIPVDVRVDVTHMNIGDHMHVKELTLPAGVEAIYKTNYGVASVVK